jgi:hypothetical protein
VNKSQSKAHGVSSDVEESTLSVSQSSNGAKAKNTSATLENTVEAKSQIGFLPTKPLEEAKETTNARLVVTFADALGELVFWRKVELVDGQEVFALCFPTNAWTTNAKGELVVKDKVSV